MHRVMIFPMLYNISTNVTKHKPLRMKQKGFREGFFHAQAGGESPGCFSHPQNPSKMKPGLCWEGFAGSVCRRKAPTRLWLLTGLGFVFHLGPRRR